ncbi:MAG: class I SAM-dependent methyltransferase [Steroidobacteraceae bacterium]
MSGGDAGPQEGDRRRARALYACARLQSWLGRREQALALCRRAVTYADYSRAYSLMSRLSLPGEDYFEVLGRVHRYVQPRTYLEIGVSRGKSLAQVLPQTQVLGIDPQPRLDGPVGPNQRIFLETSDEFFAQHDVRAELGGRPVDMAFIDGMHRFEYALRDFISVERVCARSSVILLHDCYPLDARTAQREQTTRFWSGDIWRLLLLLRTCRPDLLVHTIATPPTGLGIVLQPDPESHVLADNLEPLIGEYLAKDFSILEGRQSQLLGLVPNEWPPIRALLDRRSAAT